MVTPEMSMQIDHFIPIYLKKIKKWLGDAKKVLVVGTNSINDTTPYSLSVRFVLEADGKKVEYIDRKNWQHFSKIYHGLIKDKSNVKTILVENDEKSISPFPLNIAKNIIKQSEHYDPDNFVYINKNGVYGPEQTYTLYLYQLLSRKFSGSFL